MRITTSAHGARRVWGPFGSKMISKNNTNNNNNNNNNSINYLLPRMGSIGSKPIAAKTPRRRLDRFSVTCIVKMGPGGG